MGHLFYPDDEDSQIFKDINISLNENTCLCIVEAKYKIKYKMPVQNVIIRRPIYFISFLGLFHTNVYQKV